MLLKLVKTSPKMTYEAFYAEYQPLVYRYLYSKLGHRENAEELTSQVFLYCFEHFDRYDPDKSSMASWVFMITNSRFKNYCRDRRVFADIEELKDVIPDQGDPVGTGMLLDELREEIAKALEGLDETSRMIVVMKYFGDKSTEEIADTVGLTTGNVRVRLSRALDKMEKKLAHLREY